MHCRGAFFSLFSHVLAKATCCMCAECAPISAWPCLRQTQQADRGRAELLEVAPWARRSSRTEASAHRSICAVDVAGPPVVCRQHACASP